VTDLPIGTELFYTPDYPARLEAERLFSKILGGASQDSRVDELTVYPPEKAKRHGVISFLGTGSVAFSAGDSLGGRIKQEMMNAEKGG
jgi:N-acetylglucosamine kinase-like BadF-type ATPase